jgi:hypothetical protein
MTKYYLKYYLSFHFLFDLAFILVMIEHSSYVILATEDLLALGLKVFYNKCSKKDHNIVNITINFH